MKCFLKNRYGFAAVIVLISIVCTILFAGLLALVSRDIAGFIPLCKISFFLFFAPIDVGAILMVLTKIPEQWTVGFGCGIYYGSWVIARIIENFDLGSTFNGRLSLGIIICSLICYIVYQNLTRRKGE